MINRNKNIKLAVIGLGYVGLPLALAFAKKREVIGFDISKKRIKVLDHKTSLHGMIYNLKKEDQTKIIRFYYND